jgi:hypothetical protein
MLELNTVRQHALRMLVVAALAVAASLVSVPSARAEIAIAADFEALVPLELEDADTAPGFGIRLGWELHIPLFEFTPEIGYKWASFKGGAALNRGIIGARLGIGEIFRFGAAAHLGFAHRSEEIQGIELSNTGFTLDAGLFFDITLIPLLNIGVHIDYGRTAGDASQALEVLQWVTFGLHAALIL